MISDDLSDCIDPIPVSLQDPLEHEHTFPNIRKIAKKTSMFVKSFREALGGTSESLEMLWGVSESSWMIHDDFHEVRKIMIFIIYDA